MNPSSAATIYRRLGRHTLALLGARGFASLENSLSFRIGRNPKAVTHIVIALERSTDTYTVKTYSLRGSKLRELSHDSLVYGDDLHRLLKARTGLETQLTLERRWLMTKCVWREL